MDSEPLIYLVLFLFLLFLGLVYIAIFEPSGGYGLQWQEDKNISKSLKQELFLHSKEGRVYAYMVFYIDNSNWFDFYSGECGGVHIPLINYSGRVITNGCSRDGTNE